MAKARRQKVESRVLAEDEEEQQTGPNIAKDNLNNTIFANADPEFLRALSAMMRPRTYQAGEYIVRKGEIGSEMFFINRGMVQVVSADGNEVYDSMGSGSMCDQVH